MATLGPLEEHQGEEVLAAVGKCWVGRDEFGEVASQTPPCSEDMSLVHDVLSLVLACHNAYTLEWEH